MIDPINVGIKKTQEKSELKVMYDKLAPSFPSPFFFFLGSSEKSNDQND